MNAIRPCSCGGMQARPSGLPVRRAIPVSAHSERVILPHFNDFEPAFAMSDSASEEGSKPCHLETAESNAAREKAISRRHSSRLASFRPNRSSSRLEVSHSGTACSNVVTQGRTRTNPTGSESRMFRFVLESECGTPTVVALLSQRLCCNVVFIAAVLTTGTVDYGNTTSAKNPQKGSTGISHWNF